MPPALENVPHFFFFRHFFILRLAAEDEVCERDEGVALLRRRQPRDSVYSSLRMEERQRPRSIYPVRLQHIPPRQYSYFCTIRRVRLCGTLRMEERERPRLFYSVRLHHIALRQYFYFWTVTRGLLYDWASAFVPLSA